MKPYFGRVKRESAEERRHSGIARAAGWFVDKIQLTSRGGFPDRFYAKAGRVVLIEWKREDGEPDPRQEKRHKELRQAGVEVFVVRSIIEANRILEIK